MGPLFLSPTRLARLQARWANPTGIYTSLVNGIGSTAGWASTTDSVATSGFGFALKYAATGNASFATSAYNAAIAETFTPEGFPAAGWCDSSPFVYAWCKSALTTVQQGNLIAQVENFTAQRESLNTQLGRYALDGPGNTQTGIAAYVYGCIACQGASANGQSFTDRRTNLRNFVQNITNFFLENSGDGFWLSYDALGVPNALLIIAYHIATGEENLLLTRFPWLLKRGEVLLRTLGPNQNTSFFFQDHSAWFDQTGTLFTSQYPDEAWASAVYSDVLNANGGPLAVSQVTKYHQQTLNTHTLNNDPWSHLAITNETSWTGLAFSDDTITPQSPAQLGLPLCNHWDITGMAEFRAGWDQSADLAAQFFCGPGHVADHNYNKAGSVLIRVGGTWLIKNGAVYSGAGTPWENAAPILASQVHPFCMVQSGPTFTPSATQATRPDRDGSNPIGNAPQPGSNNLYPLSNTLTNTVRAVYPSGIMDGTSWFDDGSALAKITGDYSNQFPQLTSGGCTFGYQRGSGNVLGTYIIYDQFNAPGTISYIRRNFYSFTKPTILGETVVQGATNAGILTATGDHVVVVNGSYQVTLQFVTPLDGIDVLGGVGFENWYDGYPALGQTQGANNSYASMATDNRSLTAVKWLTGQWRTSFRTTQAIANGEMLIVATVQAAGQTAPTYNRTTALALLATPTPPPPPSGPPQMNISRGAITIMGW